jgi:hypothetical protein
MSSAPLGKPVPGNRIARFRFLDGQGRWVPMKHSPKDLLQWASEIRPDVFQRTFSMFPAVSLDRPIPDGFTVGSFLDQMARVAGGFHTPRLDVNPGVFTDDQVLQLASKLLDMPLNPRLRYLSLDNYGARVKLAGPGSLEQLLRQLLDQGWEGIELLVCGFSRTGVLFPPPPTFGKSATLVFDVPCPPYSACGQVAMWDANTTCRDLLRRSSPGARLLMNIDFPAQIDCFKQLMPDGMATIFAKVASEQSIQGFTFIWPIIQLNPPPNNSVGQWDSSQLTCSSGQTLYQVQRDLMERYNPKA